MYPVYCQALLLHNSKRMLLFGFSVIDVESPITSRLVVKTKYVSSSALELAMLSMGASSSCLSS